MKTTFKLSALTLVMALTACGSSGGDSNNPSSNSAAVADKSQAVQTGTTPAAGTQTGTTTPAADTQTGTTTPATGTQTGTTTPVADTQTDTTTPSVGTQTGTTTPATGSQTNPTSDEPQRTYRSGKGGTYGVFDDVIDSKKFNNAFFDDKNTLNGTILVVDGKNYNLSSYKHKNSQPLANSSFGYAWDSFNNKDIISVYASGTLTDASKVPTSGTATYNGSAFVYDDKQGDLVKATSSLQVDFGAKTVNGQISTTNITETFPTAKIDGNEFFGSTGKKDVRGNFFGANAEEVSGIYRNDFVVGAFGATKK